jgi:hypothetical protein
LSVFCMKVISEGSYFKAESIDIASEGRSTVGRKVPCL